MTPKAVLATIAYYDALEYPVTEFEIWKHLLFPEGGDSVQSVRFLSVVHHLRELVRQGTVVFRQGFYVLSGREALVVQRLRQERGAVTKLKRAMRLIRWCSFVPFVRMIAITGSLSMKLGNKQSDWDFLVVMKGGAIWTGRFFLTLWLELIGKRRHGRYVQDRACLNCYLADHGLEVPLRDLFSSHEYRFLYPMMGWTTIRSFELANAWMHRYRPNFMPTELPTVFLRPPIHFMQRLQTFLESMLPLSWLEPRLAAYQQRRIAANPKTLLMGGFIQATDEALIFLPEPKGPKVFEHFKNRLSHL